MDFLAVAFKLVPMFLSRLIAVSSVCVYAPMALVGKVLLIQRTTEHIRKVLVVFGISLCIRPYAPSGESPLNKTDN